MHSGNTQEKHEWNEGQGMTSQISCDQCSAVTPLYASRGWWKVLAPEPKSASQSMPTWDIWLHFCSWNCLAQYAREEAA